MFQFVSITLTEACFSFQNFRKTIKPTDNKTHISSRSFQNDYTKERIVRHPISACCTSDIKMANLKNIFKYGSVDDAAKIVFAVVFILFNGFYWWYFLCFTA